MTRTGAAATPDFEERAETYMEWAREHVREIVIGAAAVVVLVLAVLLYLRSRDVTTMSADRSLSAAQQALAVGNDALAQSDLQKIATRYSGTASGTQASMILAEVLYQKGQFQQGIDQLQKTGKSGDKDVGATIENLIGAGYEEMGKFGEAADHYKKAAAAARFPAERDNYLASAARAYTIGSNAVEARKLWTQLRDDPASTVATEARLRLGELDAKAAKS